MFRQSNSNSLWKGQFAVAKIAVRDYQNLDYFKLIEKIALARPRDVDELRQSTMSCCICLNFLFVLYICIIVMCSAVFQCNCIAVCTAVPYKQLCRTEKICLDCRPVVATRAPVRSELTKVSSFQGEGKVQRKRVIPGGAHNLEGEGGAA